MFVMEQKTYLEEGIKWENFTFDDNKQIIAMIESDKRTSIFSLLDEQFMMKKAGSDDKFYQALFGTLKPIYDGILDKPEYDKRSRTDFSISHFAGDVVYTVTDFVEKNKDSHS